MNKKIISAMIVIACSIPLFRSAVSQGASSARLETRTISHGLVRLPRRKKKDADNQTVGVGIGIAVIVAISFLIDFSHNFNA